jgi:hypothetical protein
MHRIALLVMVFSMCSVSFRRQPAQTKPTAGPSEVKIGGAVKTPFTVTLQDLKQMPRKTLRVENRKCVFPLQPLSKRPQCWILRTWN